MMVSSTFDFVALLSSNKRICSLGTPKSFMSHWLIFLASFVQERKFDTVPDLYVSIPIMTANTRVAISNLSKVIVSSKGLSVNDYDWGENVHLGWRAASCNWSRKNELLVEQDHGRCI